MPVAIVSDTCHYLPRDVVSEHGICNVSLYVHWNGQTQRESDVSDYDSYYQRLGTATDLPTTSQPSIGDFLAVYEPLLDEGNEIVSIHLAGGMSGTVRSAEQAREHLGARAELVHVVDSRSACGGQGLVVLAAAAAARSGANADAVARRAHDARSQLKLWFAIDTLEYLRRGGRIGGARAWIGSALKIKPILSLEEEITPVERVRTRARSIERLRAYARQRHEHGFDAWVVQHIQDPEAAAALASDCREIFGGEPVFISEIGPVIGAHVGPGLLGVGSVSRSVLV
jgi:fatty acid kinase fatty acid binding subunit